MVKGRRTEMDELINQVAQRTGLSHDNAKAAVDTVVGFIKQRLPAPVASQIDGFLGGTTGTTGAGGIDDLTKGLGGMFGGGGGGEKQS
jgi:hypothetical protein